MNDNMLHILAGMFARSNMGMGMPPKEAITSMKQSRHSVSLDSAVVGFCEEFMEGSDEDDHYSLFMEEGKMWVDTLKEYGEEKARSIWPDIFKLYDEA